MIARPIPVAAAGMIAVIALGCSTPMSPRTDAERSAVEAGAQVLPGAIDLFPSVAGSKLFYPLALGNRWHHQRTVTATFSAYPADQPYPIVYHSTTTRELNCAESSGGRTYLVETQTADNGSQLWVRLRQDGSGLFEGDTPLNVPPPCVPPKVAASNEPLPQAIASGVEAWLATASNVTHEPWRAAVDRLLAKRAEALSALGGPGPGELMRLRYPLYVGQEWMVRDDADFHVRARVEGVDLLTLPAGRLTGYRVRLTYPNPDPKLRVYFWYGSAGYLRQDVHAITDVVDQFGNVIGWAAIDDRDVLDAYSLVSRPGSFVHSPFGP